MSDRWRNTYYIVAGVSTLLSTALQWLSYRHRTKEAASELRDERQQLRRTLNRRMKNLLQTNLLPIRRIQFDCSEEERLEKELDAVFAKPEFVQSMSDYHALLNDFELHNRRLRAVKFSRNLSLVVCVISFAVFCFPWVAQLFDQSADFTTLSWIFLVFAIESTTAYGILSILGRKSSKLKELVVATGTEQE